MATSIKSVLTGSGAGKGSKPRPIDITTYQNNYSIIKWNKKESKQSKKCIKRNGRTIYVYGILRG